MLLLFSRWLDTNYEKIWLITGAIAIVLFILGLVARSELIYGISEDITDFYDEVLSE